MTSPTTGRQDAQREADVRAKTFPGGGRTNPQPAQDACGSGSVSSPVPGTITGQHPDTESSAPSSDQVPSKRWWLGLSVGAVAALPIGWLLSYAATLPLMLGPFFFALFGLVIGAVIYRIASPGRPYGFGVLLIGTALIVIFVFGETIILESRDFPAEMADQAARRTRTLGNRSIEEFRAQTIEGVRRYVNDNYSPGGTIGYVRWILTQGRIPAGEIEGVARTLTPLQTGLFWFFRAVLSIVLLALGIGSQTLDLRTK